ncbi:terminase small subunit [Aquimarina sp. AU119]|uniref:terminase small subunit n=1 Tax=Aquimarina sp. AU119 TaxID=2108528 RepID=UPI000D69227E|nr:terminase small subunit [Aquimarina sp. AU119]
MGGTEKTKINKPDNLNAKQKRFCEEYVIDLNATQAAIRSGYSKKTARSQAQRLLTKVDIQNYIKSLQSEIQDRNKITVDECVQILANIARFDISEVYNELGGMKAIAEIPKEHRTAITGIESEQQFDFMDGEKIPAGIIKKIRTSGKESAIDKLMKHLGGYEKDNQQKQVVIDYSKLSPETLMNIWNARNTD